MTGKQRLFMDDTQLSYEYRTARNPAQMLTILAELNAVPVDIIKQRLCGMGVALPPKRIRWDTEKAAELYRRGMPDRQIANALGISRGCVSSWRKRKRLPVNPEKKTIRVDSETWDCGVEA